jgi:hypothetical protein
LAVGCWPFVAGWLVGTTKGNIASIDFRELPDQVSSTLLHKFADSCLSDKFDDKGSSGLTIDPFFQDEVFLKIQCFINAS